MTEYRLTFFRTVLCVNWHTLINYHIDPLEVLEESNHIKTYGTILMENWRVNSFREERSNFFVNDHIWI